MYLLSSSPFLKYNTVRKILKVLEKVNLLMQGMKFRTKSYSIEIHGKTSTKSQKDQNFTRTW